MTLKEAIKEWKALKIKQATFDFTCGGDSMGDTQWEFADANGSNIKNVGELENYLDDLVYKRVEFYVNSDGHYVGESGNVIVEYDKDEKDFTFSKNASSEWNETVTSKVEYELTDAEVEFLKAHVININGSEDSSAIFNFRGDLILTDEKEALLKKLEEGITEFTRNFQPDDIEGELQDWFTYTTNENGDMDDDSSDLIIEGNKLILYIDNQTTVYKEDL